MEIDEIHLVKLWKQQEGLCAITGTKMTHDINDSGKHRVWSNGSLDRIDSAEGYTANNVQWVCNWIQTAKNDFDQKDLEDWILAAAQHIQEKREKR